MNKKNNRLLGGLSILLALGLVIMGVYNYNKNAEYESTIQKQKVEMKLKSAEIDKLAVVIAKKDIDLKVKRNLIGINENKINKQKDSINALANQVEQLESKVISQGKINKELTRKVSFKVKKERSGVDANKSNVSNVKVKTNSKGRKLTMKVTAYVAMCREGCTGITATGINIKNKTTHNGMRIIATDPSVIPLHSIVDVSIGGNHFKAISLDTGGAIRGNIVDFLVGSEGEARQFGVQKATVTVMREGK